MSLAIRVRNERLRLGWTQDGLAARAGVSALTCRRFERSGNITLKRLVGICAALGLDLTLGGRATDLPAADPRVARIRRRGLRRPRAAQPQPKSEPTFPAPTPVDEPEPAAAPASASPTPAAVTDAEVQDVTKRFRQDIRRLASTIVFNRLTNYTSAAVVQTSMRALGVADSLKPAFVAAVEAELGRLTSVNCTSLGIDARHFELWSKTWDRRLGIVRALE